MAGFVHGVLNTDNSNISGESFDYGPWRFLPRFDRGFTAAYFDEGGLYAYGRQAEALQWNLLQLARALLLLAPAEALLPPLRRWPQLVRGHVLRQTLWRLGLKRGEAPGEEALFQAFEDGLQQSGLAPDRAWFGFRGGRVPADVHPAFRPFVDLLAGFEPVPGALAHPYWADGGPVMLGIGEVEEIWAAIADGDDWAPFHAKIAAIRRMGEAHQRPAR